DGWGWIPGQRDDFRKIFRVLDDAGLILVPFQAWVPDKDPSGGAGSWGGHYQGGVQLLDFGHDALVKRGFVEHPGLVGPAVRHGDRLLTVSNELVQVVDARDRGNPRLTGSVELARNVSDLVVTGKNVIELAGDWYRGDTKLYITPASDPNSETPSHVF